MSLIGTRGHQLFPVLDAAQIDTAKQFASGPPRKFSPGEIVFDVGQRNVPMWLVIEGSMNVVRRDGLRHEAPIVTQGVGQFSGEISQLAGREALAAAEAGKEGCTGSSVRRWACAGSHDRLGRTGRNRYAGFHPAACGPHRGWRRGVGPRRPSGQS